MLYKKNYQCWVASNNQRNYNKAFNKGKKREKKTKHDWVGKVIYCELCKKFKFDYMNK